MRAMMFKVCLAFLFLAALAAAASHEEAWRSYLVWPEN